jgi:hypothetical protein
MRVFAPKQAGAGVTPVDMTTACMPAYGCPSTVKVGVVVIDTKSVVDKFLNWSWIQSKLVTSYLSVFTVSFVVSEESKTQAQEEGGCTIAD